MKRAFSSNREVAHIWAQQNQPEGHTAHMFFEGPSIFSYGRHFEIARFVTPEIVLFNCERYSVSTGKHQSLAHSAVSHKTSFIVPSMDDHNQNALYLVGGVVSEIDKLKRARKGIRYHLDYIEEKIKEAHSYLAAFRRKIKLETRESIRGLDDYREKQLPRELIDAKLKKEVEAEKLQQVKYEEQRRIAEVERLKRLEEQKDKIEEWKNGGDVYPSYEWPTLLRVKGETIETTHGANVPLIAARKLWRRFLKNSASPDLTGLNLGHYTVDSVEVTDNTTKSETEGTLIVGCHRIPFAELYRMADVLGWRNGVPFDISEVTQ